MPGGARLPSSSRRLSRRHSVASVVGDDGDCIEHRRARRVDLRPVRVRVVGDGQVAVAVLGDSHSAPRAERWAERVEILCVCVRVCVCT
jgi:hypothetical protein